MKKIDIVYNKSLNSTTGPTVNINRVYRHKDFFKERGFDLTVFSQAGYIANDNETKAIRPQKNRLLKRIKLNLRNSKIQSILYIVWLLYKDKKFIANYIDKNRVSDVVEFHETFTCYYYLKKAQLKNKTILFQHNDGHPFAMLLIYFPKLKGTFIERKLNKMFQEIIDKVDRIVFISENAKKVFSNNYPSVDEGKLKLLVNAIEDLETAPVKKPNNEKLNLISVGTISKRKGQWLVLEALNQIESRVRRSVHITFIGGGPMKDELQNYVDSHSLNEFVTFAGEMENRLVREYLDRSNIFILMSENEGLPISIIEAMRQSLPVITTNNSGMPELVNHGENGLLLDCDPESLADVLKDLQSYDWSKMGRKSRETFESKFSFDRVKSEYSAILSEL